ncbi:MAG: DUF441 domain-containing protein [Alysiella sp.]|uniref:DUF441 domain-containing protein n=1 Tax=Alysiella sp. TaxID=1872483 RepID=UPI0026DC4293|nr:DUF441 domain-containing protein [Alysiella sp.]MDO4434469.1 DUF441 domain-containing protein [Alysiella sp.]
MAQINIIAVFLVGLALLGILGNNNTLTLSATILLLIQQTALSQFLPQIEKHGVSVGIIILTIGVLAPLVSGKIALPNASELFSYKMFAAIAVGVFVAWVGARGVPIMGGQPVLIVGLMLGTIAGVAFLGGIPVGPLIAAGLLSFFINKS